MAACVPVLTITEADLARMMWRVAGTSGAPLGAPLGVAAIRFEGTTAHLDKLFVDPDAMGLGAGGALMRWAVEAARMAGAARIQVESDPQAAPFYAHYGAVQVGEVPSEAIVGRVLPLMEITL
ncbi:MAG: GNAT superfamily N-acetyltransferase [Dinoroseobacter sp.]|jgi:GNAT superfamily N-acetyltransferase